MDPRAGTRYKNLTQVKIYIVWLLYIHKQVSVADKSYTFV